MMKEKLQKKLNKLLKFFYFKYLRTFGYSKHLSRTLFRIIQTGAYIAIILIFINALALMSGKTSSLGAFGDFLGGTLNPIFTFLMLIGLVATIILQKVELSLARKEFGRSADALKSQDKNLEYQRFENTFFKLLEFLEICRNDISDEISTSAPRPLEVVGRDAIEQIYKTLRDNNLRIHTFTELGDNHSQFDEECQSIEGLNKKYTQFYSEKYGNELGPYFRTLYNLIKLVDTNPAIEEKRFYTNIVRAQLSRYELALLFYNCLSSYGNERMAPLVKKYELLKHLESEIIPPENVSILKDFVLNNQN